MYECTEKTTREEQGGVYVGVWAPPTPPHITVHLSQLTFFQWIHVFFNKAEVKLVEKEGSQP